MVNFKFLIILAENLCAEAGCKGTCSVEHTDDEDKAVCGCEDGFHLAEDQKTCVADNKCADKGCDHNCKVEGDEAVCWCNENFYLGEDGITCTCK